MKHVFSYLLLSCLLFACSKETEDTPTPTPTEKLTFTKLTTANKTIAAKEILAKVTASSGSSKTGFTIKSITLKDKSFADLSGTAPNFTLTLNKAGKFTADIVLKHASKSDVTIKAAAFEGKPESLTFSKLTTANKTITAAAILAQVKGNKTGYTVKSITLPTVSKAFATVTGTTLTLKKAGKFTASIVLKHSTKLDVTIAAAQFEGTAEKLTFTKLTTANKTIAAAAILAQVKGTKTGYTIKSITLKDKSFATLSGTSPNFTLTLKKAGSFTATVVLKHSTKLDATVSASIAGTAETLTFSKLTTALSTVATARLLEQVAGNKDGFTIKSINAPTAFATVSGTKPNFTLTLKKAGEFTATIVLQHANKLDVTIAAAAFKKTSLAFGAKLTSAIKTITKQQILDNLEGDQTGYTLKSIALPTVSQAFAEVAGSAPNLGLTLKKAGSFTATIVLEHSTKPDATVTGTFEGTAESLTFGKLETTSKTVAAAAILAKVTGTKANFTLKSIALNSGGDAFATVGGTAPDFTLTLKKAGNFTATVVLQHASKLDVTIAAAAFEGTAESLTFSKLETVNKTIDKAAILGQVKGTKGGFTLKSIALPTASQAFATVGGTAPDFTLTLKKAGSFTATIVLQHSSKLDVTIAAAAFAGTVESLTFGELKTANKTINAAAILAKVTASSGSDNTGFTLKSIALNSGGHAFATVTGTAPDLGLTLKKAGRFTATVVLQHSSKLDVTIAAAAFEGTTESLAFNKLTTLSKTVAAAELLDSVKAAMGSSKSGFTIKSVAVADASFADVAADKTLTLKKFGEFTATIVLEHSTKLPATVTATIEAPPIYLDANGVTLKAHPVTKVGEMHTYGGETYMIADRATLDAAIATNKDMSKYITSKVTAMDSLFKKNKTFDGDIGAWDTGEVTNMASMFFGATNFNQDIGKWNTAKVTNMSSMFEDATSFNQNIGSWDTGEVTYMTSIFKLATSFNQDISNWNTAKVIDMNSMFAGASSFNQDIGNWNTGEVTDMSNMFLNATSFNQDLSGWCVDQIGVGTTSAGKGRGLFNFSGHASFTGAKLPVWGTCP